MNEPGIRLAPIPAHWRRLALIGGGLLVFFWLRLEDHGVLVALLMGLVVAGLALAFWLWPRLAGRPWQSPVLVLALGLAGMALGLLTALSAALLMLLKNGFHGHLNPDYPAGLIGDTLARAPAWGLAGALLGVSVALLLLARNR
jgi:predicted lysophospholipase L1 biosynthesis ABC-type transport system permease subunit